MDNRATCFAKQVALFFVLPALPVRPALRRLRSKYCDNSKIVLGQPEGYDTLRVLTCDQAYSWQEEHLPSARLKSCSATICLMRKPTSGRQGESIRQIPFEIEIAF